MSASEQHSITQMTVETLHKILNDGQDIELIDVREPQEKAAHDIGGKLIPLASLPQRLKEIDTTKPVVVYCHAGGRSQKAAEFLITNGYSNVSNLSGGISAWLARYETKS